jgi:hypothetical protein
LQICENGQPAATTRGASILTSYDKPGVRDTVRPQLKQMRDSGFTDLRTQFPTAPQPLPGFFWVGDVKRAGSILSEYASDVAAAGFRNLEIEYGTRAASHACGYGACLDQAIIESTVKFMIAVRHMLGAPPLSMTFDMAPEECGFRGQPASIQTYVRQFVAAYLAAFPMDKTTISCGARRFVEGRASIDDAYRYAGRSGPSYYELHLYYAPSPRFESIADTIVQIREALADSRTPIVVGETGYGDAGSLAEIEDGLSDVGGELRAIYFWPKSQPWPLDCTADTAPPYLLKDALGK